MTTPRKRVNGKAKGDQFERDCANLLKAVYPTAKRKNQNCATNPEADVEGTPWRVECKNLASIGAFRFYDQAMAEKRLHDDGRPVLVLMQEKRTKQSGAVVLAGVRVEVLVGMLELIRDNTLFDVAHLESIGREAIWRQQVEAKELRAAEKAAKEAV
jgi:hypothetical protein